MRVDSKLPKTFSIHIKTNTNEGFLLYNSIQDKNGNISYIPKLTKNIKDSSKFINIDNTRKIAEKLLEKFYIDELIIIDDKTMKSHYVKKETRKSKKTK